MIERKSYFCLNLLLICAAYFIYEVVTIPTLMLAPDEFVFARHIYEYTLHIPYRDFTPLKPVLGFYLLSLPLYFSQAILTPLYLMKCEIALINTICIFITAVWAQRFFKPVAILITLILLLANHLFLLYSVDLRLDMLTTWLCLFAVLSVLDRRTVLGGVLLGLAFLVSQKAVWFILAINFAILICRLMLPQSRFTFRSLVKLNVSLGIIIFGYILYWSTISSFASVYESMFYQAYLQGNALYLPAYWDSLLTMMHVGPLLILLLPIALMMTMSAKVDVHQNEVLIFIWIWAMALVLQWFNYNEFFSYNFVYTWPILFLVYANCLSIVNLAQITRARYAVLITSIYTVSIIFIVNYWNLPNIFNLIAVLPLLLYGIYCKLWPSQQKLAISSALVIVLLTGILWPLQKTVLLTQSLNGKYQRQMIQVAAELMGDGSGYVGGVPYLYDHDQLIPGLKNLIALQAYYLSHPEQSMSDYMIESAYLSPATPEIILSIFNQQPVKLVVMSMRIWRVPTVVREYIDHHYQQYYGSLYLYAPQIIAGKQRITLKFSGKYRVDSKSRILFDNKIINSGQVIALKQGDHVSVAQNEYRLALVPDTQNFALQPDYQVENIFAMIRDL